MALGPLPRSNRPTHGLDERICAAACVASPAAGCARPPSTMSPRDSRLQPGHDLPRLSRRQGRAHGRGRRPRGRPRARPARVVSSTTPDHARGHARRRRCTVPTRALLGHEALGVPDRPTSQASCCRTSPSTGSTRCSARAVDFLAPCLERFLDATTARRTAEWVARLVVLYARAATSFDLTDPADARRLVAAHVLPGLAAATQQEQTS